jgi:hypothetical protein
MVAVEATAAAVAEVVETAVAAVAEVVETAAVVAMAGERVEPKRRPIGGRATRIGP